MKRSLIIIFIGLLVIGHCHAKDYFFKEIKTNATVKNNSDISVVEIYTYSFEGQFSYVYRSFYLDNIHAIENFRVHNLDTGNHYSVQVQNYEDQVLYKWYINAADQEQTYHLMYTIKGAIKELNNAHDYLWYSVVPVEREKHIEKTEFRIIFPHEVGLEIINKTSREANISQPMPRMIDFETGYIGPNQAFDIEFYLPGGMVEVPENFTNKPGGTALNPTSPLQSNIGLIISLLLIIGYLGVFIKVIAKGFRQYHKYGKDPEVKPQRALPELKPALAGLLLEERVDIKEIEATILDLAIRGYIFIDENERGVVFKGKEITFVKTKSPRGLSEYEKEIMNAIFGSEHRTKLSSLRYRFSRKITKIKKLIENEAIGMGLLDKESHKKSSEFLKSIGVAIALFMGIFPLAFIGMILFPVVGFFYMVSLFICAFISFSIIFVSIIFSFIIKRKTELGVMQSHKYEELRDWMKRYPLKEGRIFDEYLPYATALGVQKVWIRKLKDLEMEYNSNWYSRKYTAASFSSLHSSLGSTLGRSGSGSSGSGGGFGGGGGAGGGGAGAG